MASIQLQEMNDRIEKLEKRDVQDFLTMVEFMSNAHFFGGIKRDNCDYARDGQCSLFYLQNEAENKVPVATECRITDCKTHDHCHLETSDVTCTFCPQWNNKSLDHLEKQISRERENKRLKFVKQRLLAAHVLNSNIYYTFIKDKSPTEVKSSRQGVRPKGGKPNVKKNQSS